MTQQAEFICRYRDKTILVQANSIYKAQQEAAKIFKAKKEWEISIQKKDYEETATF
jgi:hypothetical protein